MSTLKTNKAQKADTKNKRVAPKRPRQKTTQIDGLMRLMSRETGKSVQFEIAAKQGSKVYVAGTFNNWDPTSHPLNHHPEEGVFKATLHLLAGTHEYKFVVNGVWQCDSKCPHWATNTHGTLNSVICV